MSLDQGVATPSKGYAVAMRRILVAVDDSDATTDVADFVNSFFDATTHEIVAINVARSPVAWVPGGVGYAGMYVWPIAGAAVYAPDESDDARAVLVATSEEVIANAGVDTDETMVEFGDPATAILSAADERDVDLIVIGSHRKGFLQRLVSGSVSERLVREAQRPVLVVHAREPEEIATDVSAA